MTRFLAFGGVRFLVAGMLAFALAACFVGRAEAASIFSSSFAAPSAFAQPAVSGARVVAGDRALTLSWGAVKGAAAYRVSWRGRVLKGGKPTAAWSKKWLGLKVLKASARSYKVTRLVNGAQYQLRLDSKAKAKKSRWVARSTPVASPKAVTPPPTPATVPSAPTSVSGVAGDTSVVVSWLAPSSNGGSAVTGYTVTASGGGSPSTKQCAASPCTFTGLTNGTAYTFTVKATNAHGDSVASAASAAVTPFGVPGAPTTVSGVAGDTEVTVYWTSPSSDGGSAITGYTVTASDGGSPSTKQCAASPCTVTGLTNATAYTFTVKATNARGDSVASAASAAATPATVPDAPTTVSGVAGDEQVTVSWSAPSSDGGSPVTGYTVTASGGGSQTCTVATSPCTVEGLTNATAYTFTVKATNARGDSVASVASAAVTPVISCANGGVCAVGDTGPGGGKVFYAPGGTFTETDAPCGSICRYLEAAPVDWNSGGSPDPYLQWAAGYGFGDVCSNRTISGATGTAIGSGFANTAAIMAACPAASGTNSAPAARAASTYSPTVNSAVVNGWFLPSRDELDALDTFCWDLDYSDSPCWAGVSGTNTGNPYWSSSQSVNFYKLAWQKRVGAHGYAPPLGADTEYESQSAWVRPIRAF